MHINAAVDICRAGQDIGMSSVFTDKVSTMGAAGRHETNNERDFVRFAKVDLGVDFKVYPVRTIVRSAKDVTRDMTTAKIIYTRSITSSTSSSSIAVVAVVVVVVVVWVSNDSHK